MDPEPVTRAQSAGTTVVALMATDAWERTKTGLVELWHRARPGETGTLPEELEAARSLVLRAGQLDDQTLPEIVAQSWGDRLAALATGRPDVAGDLAALLDEAADAVPPTQHGGQLTAHASGHAQIYPAGPGQT